MNKSKLYMIIGITILVLAISGSAYAYYSATISKTISGTAGGSGSLSLNVSKISNANDTLIPLDNTTEMLNKALLGYGNTSNKFDPSKACIDKNGYTVCQIYKITVTNKYSIPVTISGGVTSLKGQTTPNIACVKMTDTNTITSNSTCIGSKSLTKGDTLNNNTSKDYYILVYINNLNTTQTDTGNFTGTITFTTSDGDEIKARFNDDPALVTLNNLGLSVDTTHTPDFTTVSGENGDGTNGIYKEEDDLGTSYYFRGDVQNNYVYFGKHWWRIIRIKGDGTIRMIYTGNPNTGEHQYLDYIAYNENYDDNAYVGYMYGTPGSTSYAETHKNTNNSTIKTYIDNWYKENLLTNYSSYISDAIYCNDREVVTGNGIGTNSTRYASYDRKWFNYTPTLKCKQINDRFTISKDLGNGVLTYPIALPTVDEVMFGGVNNDDLNNDHYLYANASYWTMTPDMFFASGSSGDASVGIVNYDGVNGSDVNDTNYAVRPVVSLKSNSITGGTDTADNPFIVNESYNK